MSCSVRTGSAGSGVTLRKITKNISASYGSTIYKFTDLFPDITPQYVGLDKVTAGSTASGAPGAPYIEVRENDIDVSIPGGGQYLSATVFALY